MGVQMGLGFSVEEMTPVPQADWRPPEELPDRLYGVIGYDLETEDRGLNTGRGPGWAWEGGGRVVGYSVSADNFTGYLPVGHEGGGNMDPGLVRRWLNHVLADPSQAKVGASIMYDLGWSRRTGIKVDGPIYDVLWAGAILDEHRFSYSLNDMAKVYVGSAKDETLLRDAAEAYGVNPKSGMWKLPAKYVGPYAEQDAVLARQIWLAQNPLLGEQGLWDILELEHALMPLYLDMRWRGVRVDLDRATLLREEWSRNVTQEVEEIRRKTGVPVDIWAAASIAKAFDAEGLSYGRTAKSNAPSITSLLLETTDHWLAKAILRARQQDKLVKTFLDGQIFGQEHRGRVHGEIHPLRSDEGGTVTGRLSMSNPNLQFIPSRTENGKKIREAFLPEEGEEWYKMDFSQQEPRLAVHFASMVRRNKQPLPGAEEAVAFYRDNPDADIYTFLQDLAGLTRGQSKTLTLARIYGRGKANTAVQLQISVQEAGDLFRTFDAKVPWVGKLAEVAQEQVDKNGFIRSLLGRHSRFPDFEPANWDLRDGKGYPREKAERVWPNQVLSRFRKHKALNSLIQPSAADQTKKAMLEVYRAGLGHHILVQVHDELDASADDPRIAVEIAEIMREACPIAVPSKVDISRGPNWGKTRDLPKDIPYGPIGAEVYLPRGGRGVSRSKDVYNERIRNRANKGH